MIAAGSVATSTGYGKCGLWIQSLWDLLGDDSFVFQIKILNRKQKKITKKKKEAM